MKAVFNGKGIVFRNLMKDETFADQSEVLKLINRHVNTDRQYLAVLRPHGFGKSVIASMLEAYYSKEGEGAELFSGLKFGENEGWDRYLSKFNVIHITMTDYFPEKGQLNSAGTMIDLFTDDLRQMLYERYGDILPEGLTDSLDLLNRIYQETQEQFIFIIDEWDAMMRRFPEDEENKKYYLDILLKLLKDRAYVALAYMTGILPIKKYGEHSALNMFREISLLHADELAPYTGFTEDNVKMLCDKFGADLEKIRFWYDGYTVPGLGGEMYSVFNPLSVTTAVQNQNYKSCWTATETYEALSEYIVLNFDGLKEKIQYLSDGGEILIDPAEFKNDLSSFQGTDSVLTALVHLGYLTFRPDPDDLDSECGFVKVPNRELKREFEKTLQTAGMENLSVMLKESEKLLQAVLACDEEKTAEMVRRAHARFADPLHYNSEEALASVLLQAFQYAYIFYNIRREMPAGEGFADLYFEPLKYSSYPPMIVELKYNQTAETAIRQIHERNYIWTVKDPACQEAVLAGISYDKDTKEHTCRIEKVKMER